MKTRHLLTCIMFLLGFAVSMQAADPDGKTCATAFPLGTDYKEDITKPQTVWYTAWTFDLPLAVYFMPQNDDDPAPEVEMDFTCTKGVYTDSIICSLFCPNSGSGINIDMPHKPKLKTDRVDGRLVYYLAVGKEYRDLLLKMGISYNVEVFVKVTYNSRGTISIAPDDMFSSCMDGARFMHLGDVINVKAEDSKTHVVVPYVQWQQDSIYYIWEGSSKARVVVGNDCAFNPAPDADADESILQIVKLSAGKDTVKVTSDKISHYVHFEDNEAGMFFLKCYSTSDGVLTIKQVPPAPPRGGAALLKYNKQVSLNANDTNALFAIPQSWDTATVFNTPTDHVFKMYISNEPEFLLKDALASYQFRPSKNGHWFGLHTNEMRDLWKNTEEQYLYVRFECSERTTLLPSIWDPSECLMNTPFIPKGDTTIQVDPKNYGAKYYCFYYNEWKGGKMTFSWDNRNATCPTFIGDTCSFTPNANAEHVVKNKAIQKRGTWEITQAELAELADKVDPDGYLYIRFKTEDGGNMTISTDAPDETDPVYPRATIYVACEEGTNNIVVTVSEAQHLSIQGIAASEEWDAEPGEKKTLTLPSGEYLLQGATESVTVIVP